MIAGGLATLLVYILAFIVKPISQKASWLFLPYALWGPIGTYLTWILIQLNLGAAN
ncbi:MAG: tryptophan-rich sensory protein, partial [Hassallia sp.]|jgi:tryptophan-rich sensory protein